MACPGLPFPLTLVDLPRSRPDGGRSAPAGARRWSICRHLTGVSSRWIDHRLGRPVDGGRSATVCRPSAVAMWPPSTRSARQWPLRHPDTPM